MTIGNITLELVDIISLAIIVLMALRVTFKGFVSEFMSKAGLIVGLISALMFTTVIAPIIDERLQLGTWSNLIAFIALFFVGFIVMKLLSMALTGIMESLHLSFVDNILGFAFGAIEGAIIVSFLVFALNMQTFIDVTPYFGESWVLEILEPIAPLSINFVKENL